jgi:hypothetical protein
MGRILVAKAPMLPDPVASFVVFRISEGFWDLAPILESP